MAGKPSFARGTLPLTVAGCGTENTAVPSDTRGTRLRGGATSAVTHSSSATSSARSAGAESVGFWSCWQLPRRPTRPVPCCVPATRKNRTCSGSDRSLPSVSVCSSDAALTQYSFAELISNTRGQVPEARQRAPRPPVLPETGSCSSG